MIAVNDDQTVGWGEVRQRMNERLVRAMTVEYLSPLAGPDELRSVDGCQWCGRTGKELGWGNTCGTRCESGVVAAMEEWWYISNRYLEDRGHPTYWVLILELIDEFEPDTNPRTPASVVS